MQDPGPIGTSERGARLIAAPLLLVDPFFQHVPPLAVFRLIVEELLGDTQRDELSFRVIDDRLYDHLDITAMRIEPEADTYGEYPDREEGIKASHPLPGMPDGVPVPTLYFSPCLFGFGGQLRQQGGREVWRFLRCMIVQRHTIALELHGA